MSSFLERLRKHRDDRGMMANLRCILVENKKHRAWPVLNRLGVAIDNDVASFVSGLFATHPEEICIGNFGTTCKAIERKRDDKRSDDPKLTPTERRFQHLLSAETGHELHGRVMRMVLMAKSQGIPVNYEQMAFDLKRWSDRTKTEWAMAYWDSKTVETDEKAS